MSKTLASVDTPAVAEDAELARRAAGGDTAAFELIMRRYNRSLYRAARSILKDDAEAEDAVQDAYLNAWHALAKFRGDSALGTWLTRIAINKALERLRRRGREPNTVYEDNVVQLEAHLRMRNEDRSGDSPEQALAREQTRRLLERKIDELPAAFRTVFVLRAIEDLPVEACAQCLGVREATVRTRFFRAKRLLRQSLANEINVAGAEAFAFDGERCDRIVRTVLARITTGG
ncbi:MAG TPA: RNA polymerase sigma factor [Burkholderiales bacterium]|nr:RNA polymerase sigma factor [Burkholderiales bacterium]